MKNNPVAFVLNLLRCIYNAIASTLAHDGVEHAGYLAFLGLLAIFPFLVFVAAIVGFLGQGEAGASFITSLLDTLPDNITQAVEPRILEIVSGPPQGLLTISILGTVWTASSAVEGLRTTLNRAYHVGTPPSYWLRRSLSIVQLLIFAFLMVTGMILLLAIPLLLRDVEAWLGFHFISQHTAELGSAVFSFSIVILFLCVAAIYYVIPNLRHRFVSVLPGAAIVVIGWRLAAYFFTLYLSNFSQMTVVYGSLGGFIAVLLFFYICNLIFIFGAEFNYQFMHMLGLHSVQKEATSMDGGDVPAGKPD